MPSKADVFFAALRLAGFPVPTGASVQQVVGGLIALVGAGRGLAALRATGSYQPTPGSQHVPAVTLKEGERNLRQVAEQEVAEYKKKHPHASAADVAKLRKDLDALCSAFASAAEDVIEEEDGADASRKAWAKVRRCLQATHDDDVSTHCATPTLRKLAHERKRLARSWPDVNFFTRGAPLRKATRKTFTLWNAAAALVALSAAVAALRARGKGNKGGGADTPEEPVTPEDDEEERRDRQAAATAQAASSQAKIDALRDAHQRELDEEEARRTNELIRAHQEKTRKSNEEAATRRRRRSPFYLLTRSILYILYDRPSLLVLIPTSILAWWAYRAGAMASRLREETAVTEGVTGIADAYQRHVHSALPIAPINANVPPLARAVTAPQPAREGLFPDLDLQRRASDGGLDLFNEDEVGPDEDWNV